MSSKFILVADTVFQVYRCAWTDEDAWSRMMQHIQATVEETLKLYGQDELLSHHDLHVADERPLQVFRCLRHLCQHSLTLRFLGDTVSNHTDLHAITSDITSC